MRASEVAFVGALIQEHPWLMPILQRHLEDNDCLLPHLVLADVERWAEEHLAMSNREDAQLGSVFHSLETAYAAGNREVQELISTSFLELLPRQGEDYADLRDLLGPHLRRQLDVIG